ncbi:hypothetical protein ACRWQN_00425 [Shewanella sp. HL-SH8]|uniref:hypothetical protein n=1 Tax=Shewanella sp. HL-SH8 TaxID=3436242 RepID=UPI003EB8E647
MNNPLAGTDPTGYAADYLAGVGFGFGSNLTYDQVNLLNHAESCSFCSGEFAAGVNFSSDFKASYKVTGSLLASAFFIAKSALPSSGANSCSIKTETVQTADIGASGSKKTGVIYERTNPETGECYIGQCKSPERFEERKKEHDKKLGVKHDYQIVDQAEPGDKLDVAEHNKIQEKTAGMRAKDSDTVQNKKDPVGPARRGKLGLAEPKSSGEGKGNRFGSTKVTGTVRVSGRLDSLELKKLD